jgi:HJR/Mrr/RecB family endonuclease
MHPIIVFILVALAILLIAFIFEYNKGLYRSIRGSISSKKEPDPEMVARMAYLRDRKAQKKLERLAQEEQKKQEQEALEERRRQEQLMWEEEQRKRTEEQKKAFSKLGLIEIENDNDNEVLDDSGFDTLEYRTNENLDIDKLLKYVSKYSLEDEPFKILVNATSGSSMYFSFYVDENVYLARIGDGPIKKFPSLKSLRNYVWCFCQNEKLLETNKRIESILSSGINNAQYLRSNETEIEAYLADILHKSDYNDLFNQNAAVLHENGIALIEYELPSRNDLSWVKDYKYVAASNSIKETPLADSAIAKTYELLLYSICLRSIYEICIAKNAEGIKTVVFNGFVTAVNRATGIKERTCILSLQVSKERFLMLDLKNVDPKKCFKSLKGVSAAQLVDVSPVQPVLIFNKNDRRFIEGKDIQMNSGTNLAAMDWEDFEHLVREIFELEFSRNGGEVRVTQASRDGGVDAIVFDPDPLRGGKIVIQAKRYTNTVGVSAVRDLYGTVINEGANSGILITTSDYGHDSYEFAKDKPLKLLNGGHLLALLHKNGKEGYINIQEAKESL